MARSSWILTGFLAAPALAQTPTFTTEQISLSPVSPATLEVADFTGDGSKDVVIGGTGSPSPGAVSMLLGDGFESFAPPSIINFAASVPAVTSGDINGDGKRDLVVVTDPVTTAGSYVLMAGNGVGGFSTPASSLLSGRPADVKLMDADHDGDLDLVTVELTGTGTGFVVIRYNDGIGNFGSPGTVTTANNKIYFADFNGDGNSDLIVDGDGSLSVKTQFGNGNGGFGLPNYINLTSSPDSLCLGDFNGDGKTDFVLSLFLSPGLWCYPGAANGSFGTAIPTAMSGGISRLSAADANMDGKIDIAGIQSPSNVTLLRGNGNGTFGNATSYNVGLFPRFAALVDTNDDGRAELFGANILSPKLTILHNHTPFAGISTYGTGTPGCNGSEDMDVNKVPYVGATNLQFRCTHAPPQSLGLGIVTDVADFAGSDPYSIGVKLHVDFFTASEVYLFDFFSSPYGSGVCQLGLPSAPSLIGRTYYVQSIWVWIPGCVQLPFNVSSSRGLTMTIQGPAAVSTMPYTAALSYGIGASPTSSLLGDVNGDGRADAIAGNGGTNQVSVALGLVGGAFGAASPFTSGQNPNGVASADFNEDGKLDLATADLDDGTVSLLAGDGLGAFAAPAATTAGTAPISIAAADLNGDGHADAVASNRDSNDLTILLGDGTGALAASSVATGATPRQLALYDLNQDGVLDAVVICEGSSGLMVHLGDGLGGFSAGTLIPSGSAPSGFAIGDLNSDGVADLIVASTGNDTVERMLGLGLGSFTAPIASAVAAAPVAVTIADYNGDTRTDVAVACRDANVIAFLPGLNGTGAFAPFVTVAVGTSPRTLHSIDLSADAKVDLLTVNFGSNDLSVLLHP